MIPRGTNPVLLLVLLAQGLWVKWKTPRLPEAAGPAEGFIEGTDPVFNLIVLGESPVAGIGAPDHWQALTGQIALSLNRDRRCAVRWLAVGRSGANARVAIEELAPTLRGRKADAVVIALGVNDAIEMNSEMKWKEDIRTLVDTLRSEIGMVRIVLAGAPPLDKFPAFPNLLRNFLGRRSALLNRELAILATEMTNVIHQPMVEGMSDDHFCEDKFHPGISGYALWGEHLSRPLLTD